VIAGATGAGFTVSVAEALVTVPAVFVTTTANADPLSEVVVPGSCSSPLSLPRCCTVLLPLVSERRGSCRYHCERGRLPRCHRLIRWLARDRRRYRRRITVSVAAALVTVPAVFVTTTANVDPLSEVVVAGVV